MRDDIHPTLSGNEWTYSINLVKHHSILSLLHSSCSNKWFRVDARETNLDCTESSWQSRRKNFSPSLTPFLFNSLPASHSPLEFFFFANRTVFNLYFYCWNTLPFFSRQYLCLIPLLNHLSTCDCLQFSPFFISIENCREFLKSQTTFPSVSLRSFFFQCPIFGLLSSDFRVSCLELVICFKKVDLKEKILPFHLKQ